MEGRVILTKDEALFALNFKDGYVHTFIQPAPNMMTGMDLRESTIIELLDKAVEIEIGGDTCKRMGHAVVIHSPNGVVRFCETHADKIDHLEN